MSLVSSVSYWILVNGFPSRTLLPQWGFRKGELFLISAEGLSNLIMDAVRTNLLHRIKVRRGAPMVSHLFFADDGLLFI